MSKKRFKSNTLIIKDVPKARNEDLFLARTKVKAGRMGEKVDFTRARDKQRVYREMRDF